MSRQSKQTIKQEVIDYINANSGDENWAFDYPLDYIVEQLVNYGIESLGDIDFMDDLSNADLFTEVLERCDGKAEDRYGYLVDFAAARALMDDEICEGIVDAEDVSDFLARYAEAHAEKYDGERFAPYYGLAW